jgi:hypothetical protein
MDSYLMQGSVKTPLAKRCAILIAFITAITLFLRVYLAADAHGSVFGGILYLSQFFTILTNTLVLIVMIIIGSGWKLRRGVLEIVVIAILGVGIVYHLLLAQLWSPQGLEMLADQGVHTIVPILVIFWWLLFADMWAVSWRDALYGVIWPCLYVFYALFRAQFTGFYPYPFLNLPELGWYKFLIHLAGVSIVFLLIGLVIVAVARLRQTRIVAS